jgi:hypothetical protein
MAYAVYSTTAAAPLLWLGLRKIALTPRARLEVGYRLIPREIDCYTPSCVCDYRPAELFPHQQIHGLRPLGNALYLDRLVAGGTVGEALPLTNLLICADQCSPLGQHVDVCG